MAASAFSSTRNGSLRPAAIFSCGGVSGVKAAGKVESTCPPSARFLPSIVIVKDFPRCAPRGSRPVNIGGPAANAPNETETKSAAILHMSFTSHSPRGRHLRFHRHGHEIAHQLAGRHFADPHLDVETTRSQLPAVRAERHCVSSFMALASGGALARLGLIDGYVIGCPCHSDAAAIGR